jgi:hypothetical protein
MRVLQQVLRWIEGGDDAIDLAPTELPPPLHERFPPALRTPRAAVDVLAAMREERADLPEPADYPFHDRLVPERAYRYDRLEIDQESFARLRGAAKEAGASVTGMTCAAWLQSMAQVLRDDGPGAATEEGGPVLYLAMPTDLRPRVEPPLPAEDVMLAIGMLCTPYQIHDEAGESMGALARRVGEQVLREVDRGESHLFYRFARASSFAPDEAGFAAFAKWVDATPRNMTLSNLGALDAIEDPSWVRTITAVMGPGPNQVAFSSMTSYRGVLIVNVNTDVAKMPPEVAERLVAAYAGRLGARRVQTSYDEGATLLA